ncbi:MAG: hypothetical protein E6G94_15100 [Alphaproteobacteria bacterium]|nr:MAG: hypothetical protein E6G94_15100 [Alphaproteobacteria bacterium]
MRTSLLVVDDFIEDAEGLRQAALGLTFPPQEGYFPGRNSLQRINLEGLTEQVSDLVGERLAPISPPQSHAKCRLTLASDPGRARVHIDPSHWSGILYLSRPEDCRGGTDFFRHLPTGSDHAPVDAAELKAMGFSSYDEVHREIVAKDGLDESKWERTMQVPMQFNRLVLLRPWLWHTAGEGFGDSVENGRLVYLMFFKSEGRFPPR